MGNLGVCDRSTDRSRGFSVCGHHDDDLETHYIGDENDPGEAEVIEESTYWFHPICCKRPNYVRPPERSHDFCCEGSNSSRVCQCTGGCASRCRCYKQKEAECSHTSISVERVDAMSHSEVMEPKKHSVVHDCNGVMPNGISDVRPPPFDKAVSMEAAKPGPFPASDVKQMVLSSETRSETATSARSGGSSWRDPETGRVWPALLSGSAEGVLKLWSLDEKRCSGKLKGHTARITACRADLGLCRAVSSSADGTVKVWDLKRMAQVASLDDHGGAVMCMSADFSRQRVLSGSADCSLKVWDLGLMECICTLVGHGDAVSAVAADFGQKRIVSGSQDRTLKVWDLQRLECIGTMPGHQKGICAISADFSRSHCVSASKDWTLRIWDFENQTCLGVLHGHSKDVIAVAADFSRQMAVSASLDAKIKVWDLAGMEGRGSMEGMCSEFDALCVDFILGRAVTGSRDCALTFWDLRTLQSIGMLTGHEHGVSAVYACAGDNPPVEVL